MGMLNKIKTKFIKNKEIDFEENTGQSEPPEKFEIIFRNKDIYAIHCIERKCPFIVIKNDFFPTGIDLDFIDMNKDQFDYYESFFTFSSMMNKIIEQMKVFKMQKKQYNEIIDDVKEEIKDKISELYEKYKETNINLDTNRNYDEIKNDLIIATEFFKKYNYKFYREIEYKEGCISHCGYPDYMWQSGAERNIYKISSNS